MILLIQMQGGLQGGAYASPAAQHIKRAWRAGPLTPLGLQKYLYKVLNSS